MDLDHAKAEERIPLAARWQALLLTVGLALLLFAAMSISGVSATSSAAVTGVIVVQAIAGAMLWAMARSGQSVPVAEMIGVGLALGTLLSLVTDQILRSSGLGVAGWVLPLALIAPASIHRRDSWPVLKPIGRDESVAIAVAAVIGLGFLVPFWANHPLSVDGWWRYYVDVPFHEAMASSISTWGPNDSIFAVGEPIRYHWFAHAWTGMTADAVDAEPFVVMTRALPLVALIGTTCLTWAWARRLSQISWVPSLAVLMQVGGLYIGTDPQHGQHLFTLSPSQSLATLWLLAFSLVVTEHIADRLSGGLPLLALLAVGCVGGKVSHAVIATAGLGALALASTVQHQHVKKTWAMCLVGGGAAALAGVVLILGNAGSGFTLGVGDSARVLRLDPDLGRLGVALGLGATILAVGARWAGLAPLVWDRAWRRAPEVAYGAGCSIAALGLLAVTEQPGGSQLYFALSASSVVTVVSACGVGRAFSGLGPAGLPVGSRHPVARLAGIALVVGAVAGGLAAVLYSAGSLDRVGRYGGVVRWSAPVAAWIFVGAAAAVMMRRWRGCSRARVSRSVRALAVGSLVVSSLAAGAVAILRSNVPIDSPPFDSDLLSPASGPSEAEAELAWSDAHVRAASWLRSASQVDDVVATNRLCSDAKELPPVCSSRWFLTSSLTRRRMLIEGYSYGVGNGDLPGWAVDRAAVAMRFAEQPNLRDLRRLWDFGVRWMWVDTSVTETRSWEPHAVVGFANEAAIILRLDRPLDRGM